MKDLLSSIASYVGIQRGKTAPNGKLKKHAQALTEKNQVVNRTKATAKWQGPYYYRSFARNRRIKKARKRTR